MGDTSIISLLPDTDRVRHHYSAHHKFGKPTIGLRDGQARDHCIFDGLYLVRLLDEFGIIFIPSHIELAYLFRQVRKQFMFGVDPLQRLFEL